LSKSQIKDRKLAPALAFHIFDVFTGACVPQSKRKRIIDSQKQLLKLVAHQVSRYGNE
jgi:hypothetical protein